MYYRSPAMLSTFGLGKLWDDVRMKKSEYSSLLGYDAMSIYKKLSVFWSSLLHSSQHSVNSSRTEDESDMAQ
jgi:hypothetical protein